MKIVRVGRSFQRLRKVSGSFFLAAVSVVGFGGLLPAVTHADGGPMGTVLQQQTATLPTDLQSIATGKRVVYVTSDVNNNVVDASALIITPNVRPAHPNIVSWSHAFTGLADQCAPSNNLAYFYPEAVAAVKSYLEQGWTVTAPDFAGLGTGGNYQAAVGVTEARSVIDAVRAARNLDTSLSNEWVATGHSGGGASPLFAGEIATTYGSDLDLRGVVSMAPASNFDFIGPLSIGTPVQGEVVMALYGLSYADPNIDVGSILAAPAKRLTSVLHTGCVFDIINAYANLSPTDLLVGGQFPNSVVSAFAQYDNPGMQPSSTPILLLQGLDDQEIPPFLTELLQSEICSEGSTSFLQELSGVGHDDLPVVTTGTVSDYINARFNGDPAPSNC